MVIRRNIKERYLLYYTGISTIMNCLYAFFWRIGSNKGFSDIPKDAIKVFKRKKNIIKAQKNGLQMETIVLDIDNKIIVTTQEVNNSTKTPMILVRQVIDKSKLDETKKVFIGVGMDTKVVKDSSETVIDSINSK